MGVFYLAWTLWLPVIVHCSSVIYIQDAALDALTCTLLIQRENNHGTAKFLGEVMADADGITPCNMMIGSKIHTLCNSNASLTLSNTRGYNPFPYEFRRDCMNTIGPLENISYSVLPPYGNGEDWIAQTLMNSAEPVDVLCVTGITSLATVFQRNRSLIRKVRSLHWMAGAFDHPGNLEPRIVPYNDTTRWRHGKQVPYAQFTTWNPYAEFNVFYDPYAADWLFRNTQFPIYLAPLDLDPRIDGNLVLGELAKHQDSLVGNFLYSMYITTKTEPYYKLWNTATIATYYKPEYFLPCEITPTAVITDYANQGRLITPETDLFGARNGWRDVCVYKNFTSTGLQELYLWIATLGENGGLDIN